MTRFTPSLVACFEGIPIGSFPTPGLDHSPIAPASLLLGVPGKQRQGNSIGRNEFQVASPKWIILDCSDNGFSFGHVNTGTKSRIHRSAGVLARFLNGL